MQMQEPREPVEHIPSLEAVTSAYQEIIAHNKQNTGFGAGFGNVIKALAQSEDYIDDSSGTEIAASSIDDTIAESVTEGEMNGELQSLLHEDIFMRIGIKLTPFGDVLSGGEGQRLSSPALVPYVENPQLFIDFLGQQNPDDFQKSPDNLALTTDVIQTLQRTVAYSYGQKPNDLPEEQRTLLEQHGEDSLRTFVQLDEAYEQLGIDDPVLYQHYIKQGQTGLLDDQYKRYATAQNYLAAYRTMDKYVEYWGRGVLREYIKTGSMEELSSRILPYFDGMHDRLSQKVDDILALAREGRTATFAVEAAQALSAGLEQATEDIQSNPGEWYATDYNLTLVQRLIGKLQIAASPNSNN